MLVGRPLAVALCACSGAACAYHAGSFATVAHDFQGVHATYGCVDAAVSRRSDAVTGPVIAYEFGNGCDHAVAIDLTLVDVLARGGDGQKIVLRPYDPDHEISSALLDGRSYGAEAIGYFADSGDPALANVCVDPSAAFGGAEPRWTCFASTP